MTASDQFNSTHGVEHCLIGLALFFLIRGSLAVNEEKLQDNSGPSCQTEASRSSKPEGWCADVLGGKPEFAIGVDFGLVAGGQLVVRVAGVAHAVEREQHVVGVRIGHGVALCRHAGRRA